jgi:hypothetical protein
MLFTVFAAKIKNRFVAKFYADQQLALTDALSAHGRTGMPAEIDSRKPFVVVNFYKYDKMNGSGCTDGLQRHQFLSVVKAPVWVAYRC